jgi:drug/metabolite transporter (DMT)-like permease
VPVASSDLGDLHLVLAALDVAGVSLWLAGLQVGPTWLVGLTSSFAPLVGILGGVTLFRERPRPLQWAGVAMVLGGGVLLAVN